MLKILPIIPSRTSRPIILILFPHCHLLAIPCNFYCIGDNNVHNTHSDYYTGEQDIASADFSSEST